MIKSVFKITRMDCPSEEQLVRMKLDGVAGVEKLEFDLSDRLLTVYHTGSVAVVEAEIASLDLNSLVLSSKESGITETAEDHANERKLLMTVLLINLSFFVVELIAGIGWHSLGLVGDSFDMLADATVYALSLMAVGALLARKKMVARVNGYFQIVLAVLGLSEVVRRFLGAGETPAFAIMIIVSAFALLGNAISLYLLRPHKDGHVHMQAVWICTSTDVLVNAGVIIAGILVYATGSKLPDLIIGSIAFLIVGQGARRILKLSR